MKIFPVWMHSSVKRMMGALLGVANASRCPDRAAPSRLLRFMAAILPSGLLLLPAATNRLAAETAKVELPKYSTAKLENGASLLLMERHQLPLISFRWIMRSGGSTGDPDGREGLAALTAQLLRKGTHARSADQIAEALDFVGATFDAAATLDYSSGSAEFVQKDQELAVDLLSDLLMHPTFPKEEVEKLVKQEVDGIQEDKAVPGQVIGRYYEHFLFAAHPYGRTVGGTEVSLAGIKREDIDHFYSSHYSPSQLILAVVGDFDSSKLEAILRAKLGAWKTAKVESLTLKPAERAAGRKVLVVDKPDATQTFFRLGNLGLARTNQDWVPLQVVNTLFGGRFTSMINSELRIQSGLTYGARSSFSAHVLPGAFDIASYTPNVSTQQALDITLEVIKKLHAQGITAEQLASSKAYIKGQFGPTLETNDQLARMTSELEFYGLGKEYIATFFDRVDATTLEDARRLIKTYYPMEDLVFVLIGQKAVIEPVARKLAGDIQKKLITEPGF